MTRKSQNSSQFKQQKKLASAYRAVYAVGVLSMFLGILATVAIDKASGGIILAILFFAVGASYLILGFFVQRKSAIALGIAIAFMALNALAGIYNLLQAGSPTGLIIPTIFFSQTWEGFQAIEELKRHRC
jgi:hypothetical protein